MYRSALKKKSPSQPISRVLSAGKPTVTTIPLDGVLPRRSSYLPVRSASRLNAHLFDIAPDRGYRVSPELNRLVSVALFLTSRWTGITRYPALWSPDFPLALARQRLSG
jgi:hypothetical protein